jgi:hypothetical protein
MALSDMARRAAEFFDLGMWAAWFAALDRGFLFLLMLPFIVGLIGLWSTFRHGDEDDDGAGR